MNFILIVIVAILISIVSIILTLKSENKKDNLFLERKKSKIYNDFIELSNKEKRKADYKEYLNSDHWKEIRLKALSRAGNRCQLCSSTNSLNVHHNTYKNVGNENLKDLVVLCRECHAKFHDKVY